MSVYIYSRIVPEIWPGKSWRLRGASKTKTSFDQIGGGKPCADYRALQRTLPYYVICYFSHTSYQSTNKWSTCHQPIDNPSNRKKTFQNRLLNQDDFCHTKILSQCHASWDSFTARRVCQLPSFCLAATRARNQAAAVLKVQSVAILQQNLPGGTLDACAQWALQETCTSQDIGGGGKGAL